MNADVTIRRGVVWMTFNQTPRCRKDVIRLKIWIHEAARAGLTNLVFDVSQLTWVGAAVLGALASACRVAADRGGSVTVVGGCSSINRAISAAGLEPLLSNPAVPEYAACS